MPQQGKYTSADVAPASPAGTYTAADVDQGGAADQAAATDSGPLDELAQWGAKTFPHIGSRFSAEHPASSAQDVAEEFTRPGNNIVNAGLRTLTSIPAAAADWVGKGFQSPAAQQAERIKEHAGDKVFDPHQTIDPGVGEQYLTDTTGSLLGGAAAGEAGGALLRAPGAMKRILSGDVMAPIPGSTVSPFDRYQAAKRTGVDLNAADATNSGPLKMVQRLNKESLVGSPTYERAKGSNVQGLRRFTDQTLNEMSPIDSEQGGKLLQDTLKQNQDELKTGAANEFEDLTKQTGNKPVKGSQTVGEVARRFLDENEPLYSRFPSLRPAKSMSILNDLGTIGEKPPRPAPATFLDAPGSEFAAPAKPAAKPKLPNWSELHQLRSDVHDVYQNNPDLVQNHGNGMLQQMTHALDDAMTNGSSGLTPEQVDQFRDANQGWKMMKETYDNPSSPFYHAVRTPNASSLARGIGERTPEMVRSLAPRIGEQGMGVMRRGVTEDLLRNDKEGEFNLPTFARKFHALPEGYRRELFTVPEGPETDFNYGKPEGARTTDFNKPLEDIGTTANTLDENFNRSGSGTHGQKIAEAMAMLPTAGAPLLQYPIAKLMHNPGVVDWLMRPQSAPNPFFARGVGAAAGAAAAPKRRTSPFEQ